MQKSQTAQEGLHSPASLDWHRIRENMRRQEHRLREQAVALGYWLVGVLDCDHLDYPSFAIFWQNARMNGHPMTLAMVEDWLDQAQDVSAETTAIKLEKWARQRAAAEGLLLRASSGAFDLLLNPDVCIDPEGRQWMLRHADLHEVRSWFGGWAERRRESAATDKTLARLIPEELRNDAQGINGCGDSDERGAPSAPWDSGEGTA